MNTLSRNKFQTLFVIVASLSVSGCVNGFIASTGITNDQYIQPRVAIVAKCPGAKTGARDEFDESMLLLGVVGTLIPAVVDTGFDAIGTALQNAAKADTKIVSTRTTSNFYSVDATQEGDLKPLKIRKNFNNGCLVVAYGPMSQDKSQAKFDDGYYKSLSSVLSNKIGLQGDPNFYYEGRFVYSFDGAAFRIESQVIRYKKTIKDGASGVRGLALNFSFALPSSSAEGNVFATATIPFGNLRTGAELERSPSVGTEFATTYSTPWMPLPSINEDAKKALSQARLAQENLISTMATLKKTYVTHVDEKAEQSMDNINTTNESDLKSLVDTIDQDKIKDKLEEITNLIDLLSKEIVEKTIDHDDKIVALKERLDKERGGLDGTKEIERSIGARVSLLNAQRALERKKKELKDKVKIMAEVSMLKTADHDLHSIKESINKTAMHLEQLTPFTVTVSLVEKRDNNAILKFFADIFKAAKPDLVAAVKARVDPKTKKEWENIEKAAEAARQNEFNSLRKNAALAVSKVQGAEIELLLLKPDVNELERHNTHVKLQSANFDATDACQKAMRKSAHPPECAPYL